MKTNTKTPLPRIIEQPVAADDRTPIKFVSRKELLERIGVSYPTIWAWMRAGKFPRSRDLGGKNCWIESEVEDWMRNRPVKQLKGDALLPKSLAEA